MASIFLSYAREDSPKATGLAKALERAGHSVWWDRHIHGGAEFSGEIEAALRSADVVVVLWSNTSLRSAWVRDEAAEGRDSGRLVPVMLDECAPPLGFRQIQSISATGWSGRGNPPGFQQILTALTARVDREANPDDRQPQAREVRSTRRLALFGLAGLGALMLAVAWWTLAPGRSEASTTPVLVVLPFSDLSPEGDKGYFTEGVAEAILTVLAREPGIRVLGRSTAEQLQSASGNTQEIRKALGITHVLEGSARSIDDQLRMSVRLINAVDGRQLWAEEYRRNLDNVFAVQDEIGRAVAQRLKGSFAASGQDARPLTSADAYNLYLAARAKMRDRRLSSLQDATKLARQVIAADPKYAPGHAIYAELIWLQSYDNYGTIPVDRARRLAVPHARRAIQLAPKSAEGYAALGSVLDGKASVGPLTTAIRLDPARAELRLWLAHSLFSLGQQGEALKELQAAIDLDPLLSPAVINHASTLAASGRFDEAVTAVGRFEQRGGSQPVALKLRGDIAAFYRGDYSEGIRLVTLAMQADPQTPLARESLTYYYWLVGLPERGRELATALPLFTRLTLGDRPRLLDEIRKAGAGIWQQPDPEIAIDTLAVERDWGAIERLIDANPASLTSICGAYRRMQLGINLANALLLRNRPAEAARVLTCVKRTLSAQQAGTVRAPFVGQHSIHLAAAHVHALEGRPEPALVELEEAVAAGFRTPYQRGLLEFPAFDALRSTPRYRAVDARLKQLMASERAEVLRMQAA